MPAWVQESKQQLNDAMISRLPLILEAMKGQSGSVEGRKANIADWLAPTLDVGKEGAQFSNAFSSIGNLANTANDSVISAMNAKRAEDDARFAAQSQALAERQSQLMSQLGQGVTSGRGYRGKVGGKINFQYGNVQLPGSQYNIGVPNYQMTAGGTMGKKSKGVKGGISSQRQAVLAKAKSALGTPYVWGGGGGLSRGRKGKTTGLADSALHANASWQKGFDCSGLTDYAFSAIGKKIGYTTREQAPWAGRHGKVVPKSKLRPGDLVFGGGSINSPSGVHHVAIYWGDGKIIEAMKTGTKVHIVPMRSGQWGVSLNY